MKITKKMQSYINEIQSAKTRRDLVNTNVVIQSDTTLSWSQFEYLEDEITLKKAEFIRKERA